jgi:hypothetical protein
MSTTLEQAAFTYSDLALGTRKNVQRLTVEIRECAEVVEVNTIGIGERLIEVKGQLAHGQFGAWLEVEFRWSQDTASNLMNIARLSKENPKFSEYGGMFGRSALILLAQPGTPEAAREEAIQRAESGEKVTHSAARQIIQQHKPEPMHPIMEEIIGEVTQAGAAELERAAAS